MCVYIYVYIYMWILYIYIIYIAVPDASHLGRWVRTNYLHFLWSLVKSIAPHIVSPSDIMYIRYVQYIDRYAHYPFYTLYMHVYVCIRMYAYVYVRIYTLTYVYAHIHTQTFRDAHKVMIYSFIHTSVLSNLFDPAGRTRYNHEAAGRTSKLKSNG